MPRVLIARICRGCTERTEIGSWLAKSMLTAHIDPRITYFNDVVMDQCPTDTARNKALFIGQKLKCDIVFMVDHDNAPHPDSFTFGIDYLIRNPAHVLASPYCGSAPNRDVQVVVKDASEPDGRRRITRSEAATLTGVQPAYGVGTVLAIGMKCLDVIQPPWFFYRYFDDVHIDAGTEDMSFSEKLTDAGGVVVVDWDRWAGHAKPEMLLRPAEGGGL
jgi:hypothetical protein